jgi:hypothetical protein
LTAAASQFSAAESTHVESKKGIVAIKVFDYFARYDHAGLHATAAAAALTWATRGFVGARNTTVF